MPFLLEFKQCPICGSEETACRLGCEGEKGIPEGTFVSLIKEITPLVEPQKVAALSVPTLIAHYDVCATCGLRYCTRVEKQNIPLGFQQVQGRQPPFPRQGR